MAAGCFTTLAEARRHVAAATRCRRFAPRADSPWRRAGIRPEVIA
jgi:hypothetical protein